MLSIDSKQKWDSIYQVGIADLVKMETWLVIIEWKTQIVREATTLTCLYI